MKTNIFINRQFPHKPASAFIRPISDKSPGPYRAKRETTKARATVETVINDETNKHIESALNKTRFWENIHKRSQAGSKPAGELRIFILPDFEHYDAFSSTGTDPGLVEQIIDLLHRHGYANIVVGASVGSDDIWLENRDPLVLADLAGYRYKTGDGHNYKIINVCRNTVNAHFGKESILKDTRMNEQWLQADFRICVGKNKTHEEYSFALCAYTLLGILPLRDKEYQYQYRLPAGEVLAEIISHTPVDFCVIDAIVSNHGTWGALQNQPLRTNTLIASNDIILADWVGALKMGLDPYISPLNRSLLKVFGLPKQYEISGATAPYSGWKNVSPIYAEATRQRNKSIAVNRMVRPWLQQVNTALFPFKYPWDSQINRAVQRKLFIPGIGYFTFPGLLGINILFGRVNAMVNSQRVLHDKQKVKRQVCRLGFASHRYNAGDYRAIADYLRPLIELMDDTPGDNHGLQYRKIDNSRLWQFKKILSLPYKAFKARVAISGAVKMMGDNIGGASKVIARDKQKRVIQRVERTIVLPQPNWLCWLDAEPSDSTKIEYIGYGKKYQEIYWRMVASENQSAYYDDGLIRFEEKGAESTEITIFIRQQFASPLPGRVLNADFMPAVQAALLSDAYSGYFSRTMDKFLQAYHGTNIKTGTDISLPEEIIIYPNEFDKFQKSLVGILHRGLPYAVDFNGREDIVPVLKKLLLAGFTARITGGISPNTAGLLIEYALQIVKIHLFLNADLRKQVDAFNAQYMIELDGLEKPISVIFKNGVMDVVRKSIDKPDLTIKITDINNLLKYVLSEKPDILSALLKQHIIFDGNLNYLFKMAYLMKRLELLYTR